MTRLGDRRGLALISVLWVTVLLAVIAASLASSTRTESRLARNLAENAKAEALADGGVRRAVLALLELDPDKIWRSDGTPYRFDYGEGRVVIRIFDEDGKIDLNWAPVELLAGLLRVVGLDDDQAAAMADRIADARDEDDDRRPLGAEDPEYFEAGRAAGARDRMFVVRTELLQVLGMSERLYRRLQPYVTVHSGAEGVDPSRARPEVLRAIPGMTPELAASLSAAGPEADPYSLLDDDSLFDLEVYFLPSRQIMFSVRAEARTAGGGVFVREAVVELTAEPDRPFRIHVWRRGTLP